MVVDFILMVEKGLKEGKPNARLSFIRLAVYRVAPLFLVAMVFGFFWDIVLGKIENVDISWFFLMCFWCGETGIISEECDRQGLIIVMDYHHQRKI